jgi:transcription initiation factor TFIIH subunit 2
MTNKIAEKRRQQEEDDEEDGDLDGWGERNYSDERSWEALQEDESGLLRPLDNKAMYHAQYRRRLRSLSTASNSQRIQKGLIRFLYIVLDLSRVIIILFFFFLFSISDYIFNI